MVDVQWHPLDKGVLMSCGRQHVNFWLLEAGSLQRRQGVFGGRERPKYVTCMAFTDSGDLLTGDSDGRILLWERGEWTEGLKPTPGTCSPGTLTAGSCSGREVREQRDGARGKGR